jgi:hypothetical protein
VDSIIHNDEIIALFGIHGATGSHFVKLALDAGYRVQALVPPTSLSKVTIQHDDLTLVEGTLDDGNAKSLARVVNRATYVVCLLGKDVLPPKRDYPPHYLLQFCKTLYPIMKESSSTKLFLYQANSLAINQHGKAPVLSRILKETSNLWLGASSSSPRLKDHDDVIQYIVKEHQHSSSNDEHYNFHYIVTRPGFLKRGPSHKKLAASKSLPGPIPVTHVDLAEFTLHALLNEQLYNTCPYVVGDGF